MITLSEICRFRLTDPVLGDLRHQQGLGNEAVADECLGLHQYDAAPNRLGERQLELERIARHHLVAELHAVDLQEIGRIVLRVGLCCMVIAYLAFGIVFVSAKIVLQQRVTYNTIYMDLTDLQAALPEEQEPEQRDERSDYRDVRNLVSDENGRNESVGERSASSGNLSEATEEFMESLDEEAAAVRGRMQASREAFERGRREEREMIARHKAQREAKDGEKPSGVKQKGRVLVSYSLPGRTDVYLHTPAYQCEGGGEVTVAITVNRNGKVTAASLKETTTSSNCINETAVTAARNSRFNVDGSAADRQSGTITYIFVPQ